ncbi:unnamed protein product [Orchesella dallaii]|uniref:Gustatory receptor n=1 Tax=Orchesella dallaii TaxID=48710 RepID=A0ABP1S1F6_9HEXA
MSRGTTTIMISPLILLAYRLNQALDSFLFPAYYIHWDEKELSWKTIKNADRKKLLPFKVASFVLVGILGIGSGILIAYACIRYPGILPTEQVVLITLLWLGYLVSILYDVIVSNFGNELVALTNWQLHMDYTGKQKNQAILINKRSLLKELNKIRKGEAHWLGLLLITAFLAHLVSSVALPVGMLFLNWDPFYLILTVVSKLYGGNERIASTYLAVGIRCIISFLGSQAIFVNYRALTMTGFQLGCSILIELKMFEKNHKRLNNSSLMNYKMLSIASSTANDMFSWLYGGLLSLCFFWFVSGPNVTLYSVKVMSSVFIPCVTGFFTCLLLFVICLAFEVGCSLHNRTIRIKENWRNQLVLCKNYDRKLLRKVINGCRPLALPAGDVGIMDRDIKMCYFYETLNNTVNLMIMLGADQVI